MTTENSEMKKVLDFIKRYKDIGVESTGAEVVYFSDGLYNVDGSTHDPKKIPDHEGDNWKPLLISYGIDSNCYVTNSGAEGSHPNFSVGGHMTTNSDGSVKTGGICYLMPLCHWHNSTSKNKILFNHTETKMLKLSGYNQADLAATFQLRLPSKEPYAILYYSEESWQYQDLTEEQAMNKRTDFLPKINSEEEVKYVLFERVNKAQTLHYIREVNLPGTVY